MPVYKDPKSGRIFNVRDEKLAKFQKEYPDAILYGSDKASVLAASKPTPTPTDNKKEESLIGNTSAGALGSLNDYKVAQAKEEAAEEKLTKEEREKLLRRTKMLSAGVDAQVKQGSGLTTPTLGIGTPKQSYKLNSEGKLAPSFSDMSGKQHSSYIGAAMSDAIERNDYANSPQAQLAKARLELQELEKKEKDAQAKKKAVVAPIMPFGGGQYVGTSDDGGVATAYNAAIQMKKDEIERIERAIAREQGESVGFGSGLGSLSMRHFDFGLGDLSDAGLFLNAEEKIKHGTEEEQDAYKSLLQAKKSNDEAAEKYQDSWGYRMGEMGAHMVPFMVDLATLKGAGGGIKAGSKWAANKALKKLGEEVVEEMAEKGVVGYVKSHGLKGIGDYATDYGIKFLGGTLDDIANAAILTNTVQAGKTSSDVVGRKLGNVKEDEDGNLSFENDKTWGSAVWQAEANSIIENMSELSGDKLFDPLSLKNIKGYADVIGAKRVSDMLTKWDNKSLNGAWKYAGKLLEGVGINSITQEVGEEYYGQLWRTILGLDDAYNAEGKNLFLDKQFHKDVWGGIALTMGAMKVPQAGLAGATYVSQKHQVNKADKKASALFDADMWTSVRNVIDNTTNDNFGDVVLQINADKELSPEQKAAATEYAGRLAELRGFNLASMKQEKSPLMAMVDGAFVSGYGITQQEEMKAARQAYEDALDKFSNVMYGDSKEDIERDPMSYMEHIMQSTEFTEEEKAVYLDYLNAKSVYDGMVFRVRHDIDEVIADSDAKIDSFVYRENMTIQPATLKVGNRSVYVIAGLVEPNENGTVNTEKSSGTIVIRDAETGKLEQISPDAILSLGGQLDPFEEKQVASDLIRHKLAQEAEDKVEGVIPGAEFFVSNNGVNEIVRVDSIDGDNVTVIAADGTKFPMSKEDVILGIRAKEREGKAAGQANIQADEQASVPIYDRQDEFQVTDEKGDVFNVLVTERSEDGYALAITDANGNEVAAPFYTKDRMAEMFPIEAPVAPVSQEHAQVDSVEVQEPIEQEKPTYVRDGKTRVAYHMMPVADTIQELFGMGMEVADVQSVAESNVAEAESDIKKHEKKQPKQKTDFADPAEFIAAKQKWQAEMQVWQAEMDDINARLAYWQDVQAELAKMIPVAETSSLLPSETTETPESYIANYLGGANGVKITPESFRAETGYGLDEQRKMVGVIAKKENGGVSIERAAEIIFESGGLEELGFSGDVNDVRNIIIDILSEGNPRSYANRQAQEVHDRESAAELEYEENAKAEIAAALNFDSYDDYLAYEEIALPIALSRYGGFNESEYYSNLADEYNQTENEYEQQGIDSESEVAGTVGSGEILQGEQPASTERTEGVDVEQQGGAIQGGLQSGAEDATASEEERLVLSESDAKTVVSMMKHSAEAARELELSPEAWEAEFGENGILKTPVGEVKMGENQYFKLLKKKRTGYFGMVKPTLENPDVVLEESDPLEGAERQTKYLFVKTFIKADGSRYVHFESVTVMKDTLEVSISSHEVEEGALIKKMQQDNLLHLNNKFLDSEGRLIEPQEEGSDLVPTPNSVSSDGKATELVADEQAEDVKNNELAPVEESIEQSVGIGQNTSTIGEQVQAAEAEVNTNPTEAQKEAGNYKKGHVQIGTFNVTIEQPKGSVRSGVDNGGKKWEVEMKNTYGYIRGTEGVDGDHIDVFLSDDIDGWDGHKVFVVDQRNADGSFDEHKVMLGFNDINDAEAAYLSNYKQGWQGLGAITGVAIEDFEKWIASSHRKTKAFAEYKSVKTAEGQSASADLDKRDNLAKFNVGDVVRDYYDHKLYRIKKHSTNGVSTIAELDAEGNEVRTTTMNAHNNSRYSIAEAPVKEEKKGESANAKDEGLFKNRKFPNKTERAFAQRKALEELGIFAEVSLPKGAKWSDGKKYGVKSSKRSGSTQVIALVVGDDLYIKGIGLPGTNTNNKNNDVIVIRDFKQWQSIGDFYTAVADKADVFFAPSDEDAINATFTENGIGFNRSVLRPMSAVKKSQESNTRETGNEDEKKSENSDVKAEEKIEDVGEVLAGARKDALKVIASSFENATIQSLIELPFAKAFKKPDLKKAVESGALREEDAAFYEAWFSTMVNTAKPKLSRRVRESHVRSWAEDVYKSLQVLKEFVEADVATRDRIVAEMMANKFPTEAEELAKIEQRKEWNKGSNVTWGDKTTPNRLWVAHEVLKRLGYKAGDKIDIPYGILQANATGTGYDFYNNKGQRLVMNAVATVEEGIERIVYLTKLKRGDTDVKHPVSSFTFVPTKTDYAESGRYRVVYGSVYSPSTKEFDSLSEAEAFAKNRKDAFVSPIKEVSRQYAYKVRFVHPLTGEKMFADEKEFDTRSEAEQYLQEQYDAVNEHVNDELAKARGEKRALSADDVVEVVAAYRGGKIEYVVSVHRKYANNMGMPLPLRAFATRADAVKYASEIKEDVFKAVQQSIEDRKSFTFFATGEDTRIGEDYRQGKDVTAEEFMDAFGFRGVQFGNWTNQRDRQMAVNQAYDALHDLAKLLGVSPKALSLNGELGIAFGSRGSGNANAHYELDEVVINLTKTRGAGSLAHEWWHALDNYFARKAEVPHGMVTDSRKLAMRDELRMAFNELLEQVDKSKYLQRSKARGDYWGRMHEVTARLLAEWVDQSLKAKGEVNTFLSRGADVEKYKQMNYKLYKRATEVAGEKPMPYEEFAELDAALDGMPYPTAEEVSEFGSALRRIFDVMQERETDDGKVALFNIADESLIAERDSEAFKRATEHTIDALKAAGVEVVEATDEMVEEVLGAEFVEMQTIKVANERFNHELDDFSKKQHKGLLHLGRPMSVLTAAGVNARELTLSPTILHQHLKKHNLTVEDIKGLAGAIQSPILVYKHGETRPNLVVVTELDVHGGKLSIAIRLNEDGDVVEISNVSSVHSKDATKEIERLSLLDSNKLKDYLRWVEKEKVSDWLGLPYEEERQDANPKLVDVAKVLQDFENPKISPEFHRVYHGSGAKFDKFDHSYMGSGEGAQAFGWGTYVTEVEGIGRAYANVAQKNILADEIVNNSYHIHLMEQNIERGMREIAENEAITSFENPSEKAKIKARIAQRKKYISYAQAEISKLKKQNEFLEKNLGDIIGNRVIYTIEIPNNDGTNYLNWERGERNDGAVERIAEGLQKEGFALVPNANHTTLERDGKRVVLNAQASGADLYAELSEGLGSDRAASEFLNRIGYVGIKYPTESLSGGNKDGKSNYVIFNEADAQITDRVEFLRTADGVVYGWAVGGKIYLTKEGMNPNTPAHEYTHLWAQMVEKADPKLWGRIVGGLRGCATWNDVLNDKAYEGVWNDDNRMASEVLSRLTGAENYRREMARAQAEIANANGAFEKAEKISAWENVKKALRLFLDNVKKLMQFNAETSETADVPAWMEFVDMALGDLYGGVNPGMSGGNAELRADRFGLLEDDDALYRSDDTMYRIREDDAPKNTGIGYKVFVLKNGELYPPMVANPNGEATPVGVWLDADAAPIAGQSKTGRTQVKAGGKGTQGGSGKLAYRPGWHLGEIPYALQFNRNDENGERTLFPANFVWAEVEYANDVDYQEEAMSYGYNQNGKFQHSYAGLPRVPENGSYKYRTNPNPETDPWIITGAMRVKRLLTPTEVDEMVKAAGREPQRRQEGAVTDKQINALNAEIANDYREGVGSYTDDALSDANDLIQMATGNRRYSPKQRREYAIRLRKNMAAYAYELANRLGLDNVEVVMDASQLEGKKQRAKGFYSKSTGKITIVIPNHKDTYDIEQTVLHEAVAHYGLRKLFGPHFDTFLDNVFRSASVEVRQNISRLAANNGWDIRKATEEYLASLAEDTNFEEAERSGWWAKLKNLFLDMLAKVGINLDFELSDNELRYILWRSYQNLVEPGRYRTPYDVAVDVAKQNELKVGNYAEGSAELDAVAEEDELLREGDFEEMRKYAAVLNNVYAWNRAHKGAAKKVVVVRSKDSLQHQLAKEGVSQHVIDGVAEDMEKESEALYLPYYDMVVVLNSQASELEINGYLWHENAHKAIEQIFTKAEMEVLFKAIVGAKEKEVRDEFSSTYEEEEIAEEFLVTMLEGTYLTHPEAVEKNKLKGSVGEFNMEIGVDVFAPIINLIKNGNKEEARRDANNRLGRRGLQLVQESKEVEVRNPESASRDAQVRRKAGTLNFTTREKAIARDRYERRVKSGWYQSQEATQDSMLGLKVAMETILGKDTYIEDVAGFENAYIGENRLSSVNKAEADAFAHILFKPMLDAVAKLAKNDTQREELTDYMFAKHGLERNKVMAEADAQKAYDKHKADHPNTKKTLQDFIDKFREKDYAGLTALTGYEDVADAENEAQRMVDDYELNHDTDEMWQRINDVSNAILEKLRDCGLMSKETFDNVSAMYQYYIPLRGFDEKTSAEAYAYLTHKNSAFNAPIKKAEGRRSKADDPFSNLEAMAESAIMQGNRNKLVKQRFLNFVINHPSDLVSVSEIWLHYDEINDEWKPVFPDNIEVTDTPEEVAQKMQDFEEHMQALAEQDPDRYKRGKDAIGIPYRVVTNNDLHQHQVVVKRNGRDVVLTVNGNPRLAQALNGLTNPDVDIEGHLGKMVRSAEWVNRQLSSFYTTRNPDFMISNFVRDLLYTNSMVWIKESPNYAWRFHRNYIMVNPFKMNRLLARLRKGELDMNDTTDAVFYQFIMNGGETGYTNVRDIEQHKNDIKRELRKRNGRIPLRKAWDFLTERFDEFNRAVENCARFAAFMTSREMGRSIDRAIYDAKEISVNFNKKGSGGKFYGSVGQTTLGNAVAMTSGVGRTGFVFWNAAIQGMYNLGKQTKRHPVKVIAGLASMFLLGAIVAYLGHDDDDDDDDNAYYDLPGYVRRSNILFRTGDYWVSIPLPIEYRALYGMGELMVSAMSGKEHFTDAELAEAIASQFSQILPLDFMEGEGLSAFVPTAASPIIEAYIMNKSWTGLPIYKDTPYNKYDPEYTKAYSNASHILVGLSKWANELTGGDPYHKGWLDINPSKVEHVLEGYFGGIYGTVDKMVKMAETFGGEREFDPRNFLLVNRLVKTGDERTEYRAVNNEYFRLQEEHDILRGRLRNYERDTNNGVFDYAEKIDFIHNSPEYLRYQIFESYKPDIDYLYKELKDESLDDETRKVLEYELHEIKKKMIGKINETRK